MIIRGPYSDVDLASVTLTDYVLAQARERGRKTAIIDGGSGHTVSYGELASLVQQVTAGLAAHGVTKGDVLALCSPNCPEFAIAWYAAAAAGAIITTVNPLGTRHDMARQLEHSGARWLVTTPSIFSDRGRDAAAAAGTRATFVFGAADGATSFAALLEEQRPVPAIDLGPDDLACLPYSSGTTGLPKGVMLSHRNLVASLCQTRAVHRAGGSDVVVAALPLFHIFGLQVTLNLALREGATVVTMPRFDVEDFARLVQQHHVTRAELVPPIVLALARHPVIDTYDLSSLRLITSGAAPLGAGLARACAQRLSCRVKQGYGMTELGGATHMVPDTGSGEPESIGPPLPGIACRVVDCGTGLDARPGEPGELLVRAAGTMRGYLDSPAATAATIDPGGWLHTGDVVVADREGWFTVVDRVKELIKYKGSQVAPAALEAILLAHPAVADAAVVASPDEEAGEVPKAFVVRAGAVSADELLSFVAERVSPQEKIRRLEFVEEIPKSPSGKILRRILAEQERADSMAVGDDRG